MPSWQDAMSNILLKANYFQVYIHTLFNANQALGCKGCAHIFLDFIFETAISFCKQLGGSL